MRIYIHSVFVEPEHLRPLAVRAEELGYHGLTVHDHLLYPKNLGSTYPYAKDGLPDTSPWPDPWVTVANLAGATTELRFLSAVYLALARPPVLTAKAVATAAILSDYRVDFGMAVGWMKEECDHTGQDFRTRGRRHDELVALIREIWTGDWVEHHGEHYDYEPFRCLPAPKRPIPILGGGDSEVAMRRCARGMDGWLGANWYPADEAAALVERIHEYRREYGTQDRDFQIFISLDRTPTLDDCARFDELGVTAMWTHPWKPEGRTSSDHGLDAMLEGLEDYAERVVSKL
jgi:probable F420-dependent oxidoreductase